MRATISAAVLRSLASFRLPAAGWLWSGCCCPRPDQPRPRGDRGLRLKTLRLTAGARKAVRRRPSHLTSLASSPGTSGPVVALLELGSACVADWESSGRMEDACRYSDRPLAFLARYVRRRPLAHGAIVTAVVAAVACSVGAQYGVKILVDTLAAGVDAGTRLTDAWLGFALLATLIAADNFLWRVASWIASYTFVAVTGDLRRDLFRHLTGHAPGYFADRMPGTLTSRITATSNAVFTLQNMSVWNVMPPCMATVVAIAFVVTVSLPMAAVLMALAGILVLAMFRLAAGGRPLHHEFADRAAAVDGEMVDVVGNMPLVWSFCGIGREHYRLDATIDREMAARRRSLLYLEKLRLFHAAVTVVLIIALLAWAIVLWQNGAATAGDVVLVCTLGLSILHATRDLAVALVDVTQHLARLSEALATLLVPHHLRDHPQATSLVRSGATVAFEKIDFCYPDGRRVFSNFR